MNSNQKSANARLKRNGQIALVYFYIVFVVLAISFIYMIYMDIKNTKDLSGYCYGFFAGNALAANTVFNLGRSNIYLERHKDDKKIYYSGLYFLISAITGFVSSGIAYGEINASFNVIESLTYKSFVYICFAALITIGIIFTTLAVFKFISWLWDDYLKR